MTGTTRHRRFRRTCCACSRRPIGRSSAEISRRPRPLTGGCSPAPRLQAGPVGTRHGVVTARPRLPGMAALRRGAGSRAAPEACRAAARAAIAAGPGAPGPERLSAARRYLDMTARGSSDPGPAPEELEGAGLAGAAIRADGRGRPRLANARGAGPNRTRRRRGPSPGRVHCRALRPNRWNGRAAASGSMSGSPWPHAWGWARPGPWAWESCSCSAIRLSRAVLRLAERDGRGLAIPRGHATARGLYRAVIRAAAAYYDASVVVLAVLISAVPFGLVYGLATAAPVPGWAVPAAVLLCVVWLALAAPLARSLRFRPLEQAAGRPLRESEAPALWAMTSEVARVVGTRPVDEIRLVSGADIGVIERGRPRDKRRDRATRCLMLGMATFDGFPLSAFRAVLAHEYAHLLHRDTARSGRRRAAHRSSEHDAVLDRVLARERVVEPRLALRLGVPSFLQAGHAGGRPIRRGACRPRRRAGLRHGPDDRGPPPRHPPQCRTRRRTGTRGRRELAEGRRPTRRADAQHARNALPVDRRADQGGDRRSPAPGPHPPDPRPSPGAPPRDRAGIARSRPAGSRRLRRPGWKGRERSGPLVALRRSGGRPGGIPAPLRRGGAGATRSARRACHPRR